MLILRTQMERGATVLAALTLLGALSTSLAQTCPVSSAAVQDADENNARTRITSASLVITGIWESHGYDTEYSYVSGVRTKTGKYSRWYSFGEVCVLKASNATLEHMKTYHTSLTVYETGDDISSCTWSLPKDCSGLNKPYLLVMELNPKFETDRMWPAFLRSSVEPTQGFAYYMDAAGGSYPVTEAKAKEWLGFVEGSLGECPLPTDKTNDFYG